MGLGVSANTFRILNLAGFDWISMIGVSALHTPTRKNKLDVFTQFRGIYISAFPEFLPLAVPSFEHRSSQFNMVLMIDASWV